MPFVVACSRAAKILGRYCQHMLHELLTLLVMQVHMVLALLALSV